MRPYPRIGEALLIAIGVALGVFLTASADRSAEAATHLDLHIIAEAENGPWTYSENGRPKGFFVDIVEEIASRLGADQIEIEMQPWARAYHSLTTEPKTVIFSVGRSPNREDLFQWVGPVTVHVTYLYARAGSGLSVKSMEDAKKLGVIGVHRSSAGAQLLEDLGFTNLYPVTDALQNVRKLLLGRIDAMLGVDRNMKRRLGEIGETLESVEHLFITATAGIYIAFSLDVDPGVVEQWQRTLDEMKADGFFEQAEQKWGLI